MLALLDTSHHFYDNNLRLMPSLVDKPMRLVDQPMRAVESLHARVAARDHFASTNSSVPVEKCQADEVISLESMTAFSSRPQVGVLTKAAPLEIWEGTVSNVDFENKFIEVVLKSKTHSCVEHSAEIDFDKVSPQDRDLMRPGAVFYLSFYEERIRGTMRYMNELRFRRLPHWSATQIARVKADAEKLFQKIKVAPSAE